MGLFGAPHGVGDEGEGQKKALTSSNLSHISYNDETWHSCTLPKEDPKNI